LLQASVRGDIVSEIHRVHQALDVKPPERLEGEIVSRETSVPYTSTRCAWTAPVVRPFAVSEMTISSTPCNRRWRFLSSCGSNEESRSRGTSNGTGPTSVSTVFGRVPLRELPPITAFDRVLAVAQMLGQLGFETGLEHPLGQAGQDPVGTDQIQTLLDRG
jgi:hypothetical protein